MSAPKPRELHALADKAQRLQMQHFDGAHALPDCVVTPTGCATCNDLIAIERGLHDAAKAIAGHDWPLRKRFLASHPATRRDQIETLRAIERLATKTLDAGAVLDVAAALRSIVGYAQGGRRRLDAVLDELSPAAQRNAECSRGRERNRKRREQQKAPKSPANPGA